MSRTYKDRPTRVRFPQYNIDNKYEAFEYELEVPRVDWHGKPVIYGKFWLKPAGVIPKRKREEDTEWHWMCSTPSWWTRMFMRRPERARANRQVAKIKYVVDLEDVDIPDLKRKPHVYYY